MGRGKVLISMALALSFALPATAIAQVPDDYPYGPDESPAGANDFSCTPTATHPEPVVLVHGLGANMAQNWGYVSPALAADGYCVFALTYGRDTGHPVPFNQMGGLRPMDESAKELAALIDDVLEATGAEQVDIVGHSEGSLMPNYYVKFMDEARYEDGALKVDDYVGLTPLWDGTDVGGLATLDEMGGGQGSEWFVDACGSCVQLLKGSDFIEKMNSDGGPNVPGVTYTMVMTKNDELVSPYTSGIMDGAVNLILQEQCAADPSEHLMVAFNPLALQDIRNALDPANAQPVGCATYAG